MPSAHKSVFDSNVDTSHIEIYGHVMRRGVTKDSEEVLFLKQDELSVYSRPNTRITSEHYYCSCGREYEDSQSAEEHLMEVREGEFD